MKDSKKVLIFTYYWPPSGGSGVQRWMYFTKYLKQLGWEPIVITVNEKQASYPVLDFELLEQVKDIQVIKTDTKEPLKIFINSLIFGNSKPVPLPLGYLNADGLSLMFIEVFIILTNSDSSLAAITIKFGKVDK